MENYSTSRICGTIIAPTTKNELAAARLKKGTAQLFRLANLPRNFINLSWYDINIEALIMVYKYLIGREISEQKDKYNEAVAVEGIPGYHSDTLTRKNRVLDERNTHVNFGGGAVGVPVSEAVKSNSPFLTSFFFP